MARPGWIMAFLFALLLALTGLLLPGQMAVQERSTHSGGVLAMLLGDGRRMFANHFFKKADAYFHHGRYPGIFDDQPKEEEHHMLEGASAEAGHSGETHQHDDHGHETGVTEGPDDWLARLGQRFRPNAHWELEGADTREILPWLKLSAELDPHNTLVFAFTGYWLRTRLNKVTEAEQFLRDGLRANPDSYEIYYELSQLFQVSRSDLNRTRTLLELALTKWEKLEAKKEKEERDDFSLRDILGAQAKVDEALGDYAGAIATFQRLKTLSPNPESVQKRIDELQAIHATGTETNAPMR